jgi:hypothetical protein
VKPKAEAARLGWKKGVAKRRPHEQERAVRPDTGDERAGKREIQQSPKDVYGRAWRCDLKVHIFTRGDLIDES